MISIVALWILAVLSLASVGSAHRVSLELKVAQYELDRLRAAEAAEAGVRRAASEIQACLAGTGCDGKGWMDNPEAFEDVELDGSSFSVRYIRRSPDGAEATVYGIRDEECRINVNRASQQILERIPGMSGEVVLRIIESRKGGVRPGFDQEVFGYATLDEMRKRAGLPDDVFEMIEPYLTAYGSGRVNVNTAAPEVLLALGIPPAVVGRIEILRSAGNPFTSSELIMDDLETMGPLISEEIRALQFLTARGILSTISTAFRVESEGRSGRAKVTIEAVLERRDRGGLVATYWRRT